jgi:integrase
MKKIHGAPSWDLVLSHLAELSSEATGKTFKSSALLALGDPPSAIANSLSRMLAALRRTNPSTPRYARMYDLRVVLSWISSVDCDTLVSARDKLLVLLAFDTGQRCGGLANLRRSQCRREGSFLFVRIWKPKVRSEGVLSLIHI